jgi:hypothetical protein
MRNTYEKALEAEKLKHAAEVADLKATSRESTAHWEAS